MEVFQQFCCATTKTGGTIAADGGKVYAETVCRGGGK